MTKFQILIINYMVLKKSGYKLFVTDISFVATFHKAITFYCMDISFCDVGNQFFVYSDMFH